MKFDWNVFFIKITSRKFWVALAGLITSIMAFFNCNNETIVQVAAIIAAVGTVVGYLIANGLTDDAIKTAEAEKQSDADQIATFISTVATAITDSITATTQRSVETINKTKEGE